MRALSFALLALWAAPAIAQDERQPIFSVTQNGDAVAFDMVDGVSMAHLAAGPFELVAEPVLTDPIYVSFGTEGLFDLIDAPGYSGLFGPANSYARYDGPYAAHYMEDPLCADPDYGPGFNWLDETHRVGAAYPVAAIHADSASRDCTAEGRWPTEEDLIGRVSPLYVVIQAKGQTHRLILHFVSG